MINLDLTYCASTSCKNLCNRQLTLEQRIFADTNGLDLWYGLFCDKEGNLLDE